MSSKINRTQNYSRYQEKKEQVYHRFACSPSWTYIQGIKYTVQFVTGRRSTRGPPAGNYEDISFDTPTETRKQHCAEVFPVCQRLHASCGCMDCTSTLLAILRTVYLTDIFKILMQIQAMTMCSCGINTMSQEAQIISTQRLGLLTNTFTHDTSCFSPSCRNLSAIWLADYPESSNHWLYCTNLRWGSSGSHILCPSARFVETVVTINIPTLSNKAEAVHDVTSRQHFSPWTGA